MSIKPSDISRYQMLMQQGKPAKALDYLVSLLNKYPLDRALCLNTAKLAHKLGNIELSVRCYEALLDGPTLKPVDYFNIGYALKTLERFDAALRAYQISLDSGIDRPEEVYLNMGVIYADALHNEAKAAELFETAIHANPALLSPYINLGNLYEETGQFGRAAATYKSAVKHIPDAYEALARQANASSFSSAQDPLLIELQNAAESTGPTDFDKECLHFALGTALDSLGEYGPAFEHFTKANNHGQIYGRPYDRSALEKQIDDIISQYSPAYFKAINSCHSGDTPAEAQPVFICGMFRSGSTLTEQIVGAHPNVTPLGELDFFAKYAVASPGFYPHAASSLNRAAKQALAQKYLAQEAVQKTATPLFSDKRPDNALYLGLIKTVFPTAKIIHTERSALDNYLSIYFTQFGDGQAYARNLSDIQHYHQQHKRLMEHWRVCFGSDIHDVHYDTCVAQPEETIKALLTFLALSWTPDVLDFHKHTNRVKTASYKQVRMPLYGTSSGRVKHYQAYLPKL